MNYNDSILENKGFNFFKQLIYNIAVAICIVLMFALILVWGFKFQLYKVLSDSEAPYFTEGDMIVVRKQDDYKVGDIIKFTYLDDSPLNVTHRLVGIKQHNGKTYYIAHGDAVGTSNPFNASEGAVHWKKEVEFIENLTFEQVQGNKEIPSPSGNSSATIRRSQIQIVEKSAIDGKVLCWFANYGNYFEFIKEHKYLLIAMVVSVWCISGVIQNELELKKSRRLEA